jgi:hypothetical protein
MTPTTTPGPDSPGTHPEDGWGEGPSGAHATSGPQPVSFRGTLALGVLLTLLLVGSLYGMIAIWPAVDSATTDPPTQATITLFGFTWQPKGEVALLMMVTLASALGGSLHAAISFTDYVGNRRLTTSWMWWYVMRVLLGVSLAVLFYFALRGGLFSANTTTDNINPFGIAALAGLVGLFSKQATDKLRELFDTMFSTAPGHGDDQRADGIVNPRPHISGIDPPAADAGVAVLDIRVRGDGFIARSVVCVTRPQEAKALRRKTEFLSATELRVRLGPRDLADAGVLRVTVRNPSPGGGESGAAELELRAPAVEPAVAATTNGGTD